MLFRICVACDHTNPSDAKFCADCGAPLQVKFCRNCRAANDCVAHFCQTCGTVLPDYVPDPHVLTQPAASSTPSSSPKEPVAPSDCPSPAVGAAAVAPAGGAQVEPTIVKAVSSDFAEGDGRPAVGNAAAIEVMKEPLSTAFMGDRSLPLSFNAPVVVDANRLMPHRWRSGPVGLLAGLLLLLAAAAGTMLTVGRSQAPLQEPARSKAEEITAAPAPYTGATTMPSSPPGALAAGAERTETAPTKPPAPAKASKSRTRDSSPSPGEAAAGPRPPPTLGATTVRECTPALASLGLCTGGNQPGGN